MLNRLQLPSRLIWSSAILALLAIAGCSISREDDATATATDQPTAAIVSPEPSNTPQSSATAGVVEPTVDTETPASPTITSIPTAEPTPMPTEPTTPTQADLALISLEFEPVAGGLEQPVGLADPGDGSGRIFVLEQEGRIRIIQDNVVLDPPFLDIRERVGSEAQEQGLLGLAFHPDYANNGRFFINYTDNNGDTVISSFVVSDDPAIADADSETVILQLDQPASNHNGGWLLFGPDGYLFIGTGDGGGSGDRFNNAQNTATLLGAMLRIDVDSVAPYGIPADNPYAGNPDIRGEFWAIGLRNPWRYSFDRLTGDLYIADVGQGKWEEINFQPATSVGGENYGWPYFEGTHCFTEGACDDTSGLTMPVAEYDHDFGCSVTGGYVYRGELSPILSGVYLYGDFCSGHIWGLIRQKDGTWQNRMLVESSPFGISAFGEDQTGEMYLVDYSGGTVYHIIAR